MTASTEVKQQGNITGDLIRLIDNMAGELESFRETLEILNDRETMDGLKRSGEDVKAGRVGVIKNKKDISKLFED